MQPEIDYLGHTINAKEFKQLNTNINVIAQVTNPRAAKQVHSFLQMANFYRKFIHNFTELTRPLRPFQKENKKFYWDEQEQIAWDALKTALTTPPVFFTFSSVRQYREEKFPFVLSTNAP
ncbi:unnamed protein product [Rotaria socialis]|uniref:Reverse transcriptase/retrotransposon-derived protein RNase H-like domain-containing protein n=2 Tax=Rotaria socialis TaxID=392032 RepID=A0A818EU14_9BILA|nr:unnamed protein product [Rotaria socialis]CAF3405346.1 unnamed protein product [Rotaria socialis]CAF3454152.1 unnamed protein product [Rotaria socialis]CAF3464428.1 unnamed protein product [Rotaria socialis]CAF3587098.1 unnamed protein product [Rotaria socialis]